MTRRHHHLGRINDKLTYCRTQQYLRRPQNVRFLVLTFNNMTVQLSPLLLQGKDVAGVPHSDEPLYHCGGVRRCDQGQTFVALIGAQDMPPGHWGTTRVRDHKR